MEYKNILYENFKRDDSSQYGEDGMVEEILRRLKINKGVAVDIGAGDGIWYSNTYNLVKKGWEVFEIEGNEKKGLKEFSDKYENVTAVNAFIIEENVNKILEEMGCPKEIDLMSFDIDSIEYWVWEKLEFNPKIMIVEIEPRNYPLDMIFHCRDNTKSKEELREKINPPQNLTGFGPMFEMAKKKGYHLIGHTISNLIFLRNDVVEKLDWEEVTGVNQLSNFNPIYLSEEDKKRWSLY